MPLYEYECEACGNHLEAQQKLADAPLTRCPTCGKDKLQRVISATAFHLKGGGWYKDLYSSAKPGASSSSGDSGKSDSAASPSSSSDTKTSDKKGDKGGSGSSGTGSSGGSTPGGSGKSGSSAAAA